MKFRLGNNEGRPFGATVWGMGLEVGPPTDCAISVATIPLNHMGNDFGWIPQHADLKSIVQSASDWHKRHPPARHKRVVQLLR
jgi:hypothetical protein